MATVYDRLGKVRKPRVHLRLDVKTGDAVSQVELPFVVGVMGDFAGDGGDKNQSFSDREFLAIDSQTFPNVLEQIAPKLTLRVAEKLQNSGNDVAIELTFRSMNDFTPAAIAKQVPQLRKLLEVRDRLRDLASTADRSPRLEAELSEFLKRDFKELTSNGEQIKSSDDGA